MSKLHVSTFQKLNFSLMYFALLIENIHLFIRTRPLYIHTKIFTSRMFLLHLKLHLLRFYSNQVHKVHLFRFQSHVGSLSYIHSDVAQTLVQQVRLIWLLEK